MKTFTRFIVLLSAVTLALPAPAFALRQTGLEENEKLRTRLTHDLRSPSTPAAGLEEGSPLGVRLRELRSQLIGAIERQDWPQMEKLLSEIPAMAETERTDSIEVHLQNLQALRAVFLTRPHLLDPTPSETKDRHFEEALVLIPQLLEGNSLVDPGVQDYLRKALIYVVGGLGEVGLLTGSQARAILFDPKIRLPEGSVWSTLFGFSLLELLQFAEKHTGVGESALHVTTSDPDFRPLIANVLAALTLAVTADPEQWIDPEWEQDRIARFARSLIFNFADAAQENSAVLSNKSVMDLLPVAQTIGPIRSDLRLEMRKGIPDQAVILNLAAVGARMLEPMAEWLGLEKTADNLHEAGNTYAAELIRDYRGRSFWRRNLFPEFRSAGGLEEVRVLSVEELLERVRGAPPVVPAGRSHAVLIPKDGSAIPPQQGEVALYAHKSVMDSIRQFLLGQRLTTGPVTQHEIQIDNLSQANFMVRQATESMRSGRAVVIALRSGWTTGIQLPSDHAPALLVDPETWPGVDQKVLAAYLVRQDKLLGLLLDLSSGSIGAVRLDDGQKYDVLFASV